jgi:alcohol dehydrogenase, propanol-preferring
MKATVLKSTGPVETERLELVDLPIPEPGPEQVRIRVKACGLCHTDLHIIEAEIPTHKLPLIPGHQIVGVVDAIGAGVKEWRPGARVGVPWLNRACGVCEYCRSGRENLCERGTFTGYDVDGGLAQYTVQHQDWIYALPHDYPDLAAAPLMCAGIIGLRALRLSEIRPGQVLGLFGFGASAHIALQVARYWGCEIMVFTRGEQHRELAKSLGAGWNGALAEAPPEALDAAIVFAPAGEVVPQALARTRKGGTVALAGIYMSPVPAMDYRLLYHERTLRSVANSTRADCRELLALAPRVPIRTEVEVFPLEEVNRALLLLKQSRIQGAAVIEISP